MKRLQITQWCHERIRQMMPHPVHCLDATAGTGRDTIFLTRVADRAGTIIAMDIQAEAIRQTKTRLMEACPERPVVIAKALEKDLGIEAGNGLTADVIADSMLYRQSGMEISSGFNGQEGSYRGYIYLIQDGHEHMEHYVEHETLDLVLFNLGYLPGGDHSLSTKAETTVAALDQSLALLKEGGLLSVLIYSGGDNGFAEKEAVLQWAGELDSDRYLVILESFYNRPNHPPLPLFVIKLHG